MKKDTKMIKNKFNLAGLVFTYWNLGIFTIFKSEFPEPHLATDYSFDIVFHAPGKGGINSFAGYRSRTVFTKYKDSSWKLGEVYE